MTKDPETREVGATSLCTLRLAVNASRKNAQGEWEDKPNYFDVNVWGPQGVNCAKYLTKGSSVAIDGRLEFQEWEKDGNKQSKVLVIAQQVQFLRTGDNEASSTASSETDDIPF